MTTRVCTVCGEDKPITEFPKNGKDKQGKPRHRTDCKTCYAITRKLTKRKAVSKFLNNTKHRTGEEDTYTLQDWKDAMLHFRGGCSYCGRKQSRKLRLTKDHVVPVSKGGLTVRTNIAPACSRCNSSKNDSDLKIWYLKQKFYCKEREATLNEWTSIPTQQDG